MYEGLSLYAVCLNTAEVARPDDFWIEFYWAEDGDHAEEQAENANPECAIVCVAVAQQYVADFVDVAIARHLDSMRAYSRKE